MKNLFFLFAIATVIYSCSRKESDVVKNNEHQSISLIDIIRKSLIVTSSDSPAHGTLSLGAVRNTSGSGSATYYLNGDFFSSRNRLPNERIEIGQIDYGSITVTSNGSNSNAYYLSTSQSSNQGNSSNFGKTVMFSASGNSTLGISSFSDNIYIPEEIVLNGPFASQDLGEQSKSSTLTVTWNQDANNTNGVAVMLIYDVVLSNLDDSILTDSTVILKYITPDNGTFSIPSSAFNPFQAGSIFTLAVGRLNAGVKVTSGYRFQIQGYSYASTLFRLIN